MQGKKENIYLKTSTPQPLMYVNNRGPKSLAGLRAYPQFEPIETPMTSTKAPTKTGWRQSGTEVFLWSPRARIHSIRAAVPITLKTWKQLCRKQNNLIGPKNKYNICVSIVSWNQITFAKLQVRLSFTLDYDGNKDRPFYDDDDDSNWPGRWLLPTNWGNQLGRLRIYLRWRWVPSLSADLRCTLGWLLQTFHRTHTFKHTDIQNHQITYSFVSMNKDTFSKCISPHE